MARLIDADKYCEFLNNYPLEKAQNNSMVFYREALQETFKYEVEAIPVDWLKAKAEKWASRNDVLMWGQCVKLLIEDWEKENEIDR